MIGKKYDKGEDYVAKYDMRTNAREKTLMKATMNFVAYFMGLGDDQLTAEGKVGQVSTHLAQYLYVYTLGNVAPLLSGINNIDEGAMPFMNAAAKAKLVGDLSA